jgi:hypothetical protein
MRNLRAWSAGTLLVPLALMWINLSSDYDSITPRASETLQVQTVLSESVENLTVSARLTPLAPSTSTNSGMIFSCVLIVMLVVFGLYYTYKNRKGNQKDGSDPVDLKAGEQVPDCLNHTVSNIVNEQVNETVRDSSDCPFETCMSLTCR